MTRIKNMLKHAKKNRTVPEKKKKKKTFLGLLLALAVKKHAKWYQGKKISGIFLASVCPKEYKNCKNFDRPFFGPRRSISSTVYSNFDGEIFQVFF